MIKNIFQYILILICFASCSPEKRVARIAERYNLYQIEQIVLRDTVYIPSRTYNIETELDKSGYFSYSKEIIIDGKVKGDSIVILKVITPADTVYIEKEVKAKTITITKQEKTRNDFLMIICLFGFCLVSILYIFKKLKVNS